MGVIYHNDDMNQVTLPPEKFDIATAYIANSFDASKTAEAIGLPISEVIDTIKDKEVGKYLNEIYLDLGYRNRQKLGSLLDRVIDSKLEEALETGIYSSKDLLEWMKLAIQLRESDIKAQQTVTTQTNVQINDYSNTNIGALMEHLMPKK